MIVHTRIESSHLAGNLLDDPSERDVFVMQNLVFLYAVVFVLLNIAVDLISAWLDPRIRYA